jgi:hypothetical protein
MIQLFKYFRILFLSAQISRDVLKNFTENHIQRLTGNNPGGIFTTILANVTNAYNAYYGDYSSEVTNIAAREGLTDGVKSSRAALEKFISDTEKLVRYTYRDNETVYQQFFPQGMTEYYNATISNFETICDRLKAAFTAHSGDFTPLLISDYNTLLTTFKNNRSAQLLAKGSVSTERSELAASRLTLATQLTKNLLTISLQYLGDTTKADVYFDQAILDEAFRRAERRVTSEIDPGELQNAFDNVSTGEQNISLKNEGETDLVAGFVSTADEVPTLVTVPMGNEVTKNAAEWGWTSEKKFFNISNGTGLSGKYTASR